ncbi:MAG: regulatory protein RecX [Propionibacteriaceae bacterium]
MLRALERQARTKAELATLLAKRGIPDDAAQAVLDRFCEVGLIDDAAFAQAWVADRQQRRHLSSRALRSELYRKGVDKHEIDEAVSAVSGDAEYQAAHDFAESRLARMSALDQVTIRRRLGGQLSRRGFSGAVVSRVLAELLSGVDDSQWGL